MNTVRVGFFVSAVVAACAAACGENTDRSGESSAVADANHAEYGTADIARGNTTGTDAASDAGTRETVCTCTDGIHTCRGYSNCTDGLCETFEIDKSCEHGCTKHGCISPPPPRACTKDTECEKLIIACVLNPASAVLVWEPAGCVQGTCAHQQARVACSRGCALQEEFWQCSEFYDWDSDGFTQAEGDCAPDNSAINPSAYEFCDLQDNNCDGITDEPLFLPCRPCEQDADCDAVLCDGLRSPSLCGGYEHSCWGGFCAGMWSSNDARACEEHGCPQPPPSPK